MKILKKHDKIAVISPAGSVEECQLIPALELIRKQGYEPVLGKYALGEYCKGYSYSGTEEERIADLNWAFNDDKISAIWATRGGYGCQHLLKYLEINRLKESPKWYIGYSDNTAIQSFLLTNGIPSIHGQTIKTSSFGVVEDAYKQIFNILEGNNPIYSIDNHIYNKKSDFEGILVGGNLSLVYALLGSPYSVDFQEKILFIEDIGEDFYALDRMLISLDLAGVFGKIKGLIIGGMSNMGSEKTNPNYDNSYDALAYEIIADRIKSYDFPVIFGFPNGHIYNNLPVIIGGNIKVDFGEKINIRFT